MRSQVSLLAVLALSALALSALTPPARAQQVYVGSANGWDAMNAHPEQWAFVRHHADGFYVNFIQMLKPDAKKCARTSALFTNKNAYYESDSRSAGLGGFPDGGQFSRAFQAQQLQALLDGGFKVPYTSLNYGVDDLKLADLKRQGLAPGVSRPCLAQNGPWTFSGGDIMAEGGDNARMRADTARTDGASTDGPLSLWQADQGQMRTGSFSLVKYAHRLHKTAAVMVTPYNLSPPSLWLAAAQGCVRQHEDAGAKPDIWIVFEYATDTPTLPETVNGKPADTITGMAYWLIHHVQDPKHWARLTGPAAGSGGAQTVTVRNNSTWMDLCPVLSARVKDPAQAWDVRFRLGGRDVTRQITSGSGLPFLGALRLWPGSAEQMQVVVERRKSGGHDTAPPLVEIGLRPNPAAPARAAQVLTLRPTAGRVARGR